MTVECDMRDPSFPEKVAPSVPKGGFTIIAEDHSLPEWNIRVVDGKVYLGKTAFRKFLPYAQSKWESAKPSLN